MNHCATLSPLLPRVWRMVGFLAFTGWIALAPIQAQQAPTNTPPVQVSLSVSTNRLTVGQTATLRATAQIVPSLRSKADQIFSWNVDLIVIQENSTRLATVELLRSASDREVETSSSGVADGSDLRGIHDTFLNRPHAGRDEPVELFSVPIVATGAGEVIVLLRPGSGLFQLEQDFLTLPSSDEAFWTGADYSTASLTLTITNPEVSRPNLSIEILSPGRIRLQLSAGNLDGWTLETSSDLVAWTAVPGTLKPAMDLDSPLPGQFYRLRK